MSHFDSPQDRIIIPDVKERVLHYQIQGKLHRLDKELSRVDSGIPIFGSCTNTYEMHDSEKIRTMERSLDMITDIAGKIFRIKDTQLFWDTLEELVDRRRRYYNIMSCGYFDFESNTEELEPEEEQSGENESFSLENGDCNEQRK